MSNTRGSGSAKGHAQPVARDYVEEIQQRAARSSQLTDSNGNADREAASVKHRGQRFEQETARVWSDSAEASRLSEGIENLSNETAQPKRNRIMTETSADKQRQAQQHRRREANAAKAGTGKLSFNPLHPSMELPPEQLIRLLGLETKKTRKHQKGLQAVADKSRKQTVTQARPINETKPVAEPKPVVEIKPAPKSKPVTEVKPDIARPAPKRRAATASRSARREPAAPAVFENKRTGLLVPATAIGVLAGALISAFLLWPENGPAPKTAAVTAPPPAQRIERAAGAKKNTKKPVPAPTADQAELRAAIEAEQRRLRNEAEQRLRERLRQSPARQETPAAPPVFSYETAEAALVPPVTGDNPPPDSEELLELEPPQPVAQGLGAPPGVDPATPSDGVTTLTPGAQTAHAAEMDHTAGRIDSEPVATDPTTANQVAPTWDDTDLDEDIPTMESEGTDAPMRSEPVDGEPLVEEDALSTLDSGSESQAEYDASGEDSFAGQQATSGSEIAEDSLSGEAADIEPFATPGATDAEVTDEHRAEKPVADEPIVKETLSPLESTIESQVENVETGKQDLAIEPEATYSSP